MESSHIVCTSPSDIDSHDVQATLALELLNVSDAIYTIRWYKGTTELHRFANRTTIPVPALAARTLPDWYTADVELGLPQVRLEGREEMRGKVKIWFQGCD